MCDALPTVRASTSMCARQDIQTRSSVGQLPGLESEAKSEVP